MNRDELATGYADDMVASIADIMGRAAGETHDDDCERGGYCETCGARMFRTTDETGWACVNDCADYVPDDAHDDEPCDCQSRASDELTESYALELVSQVGSPYEVVLTVGGPDARVVWDGRYGTQSAVLEVVWGPGGTVTRRTPAIRALADHYSELMGVEL